MTGRKMTDVCKSKKDLERVIEEGLTTASNYARQQTKEAEVLFQIMHNYPVKFSIAGCRGEKLHTVVGFFLFYKA